MAAIRAVGVHGDPCGAMRCIAGKILNSYSEGNCNVKREPAAVHHLHGFPQLSGPISQLCIKEATLAIFRSLTKLPHII